MKFSLNKFLLSVSLGLDYVERDVFGSVLNHGKRVGYGCMMLAKTLGLDEDDQYDLISLAVLHDNGLSEYVTNHHIRHRIKQSQLEGTKEHCVIGEDNVKKYPFLHDERDILLYHHERLDGSGIFHLHGNEIPLKSQIICLLDTLDLDFNLSTVCGDYQEEVEDYIKSVTGKEFAPELCEAFLENLQSPHYHIDMRDNNIWDSLERYMPRRYIEADYAQIKEITAIFSRIIINKSRFTSKHSHGLSDKAAHMAAFYNFDEEETLKFSIAADLHDLGKLLVPNRILEAPRKLTNDEFATIQEHPYYTRKALKDISGFKDITEWAANHHEKLNGKGYPYGLTAKELDFNSRLMSCLDIYQALTEERPYRAGMSHQDAMKILNAMAKSGYIDKSIVADINKELAQLR